MMNTIELMLETLNKQIYSGCKMPMQGTSHFVSFQKAVIYYSAYGYPREQVEQKLQDGEIAIGVPQVLPTQRVILHPMEGRYFIEDRA